MNQREKFLLKILLFAGLVAGLLFGFKNIYEPRFKTAQLELTEATLNTEAMRQFINMKDLVADEQVWLTENSPKATTAQAAQSQLQKECEERASSAELEIKKQTPLSSVLPDGSFYHRARMEMLVSGKEANFYNCITSLDDPKAFRRITKLRMNPLRDDDTLIEAQFVVEQWFTPETEIEP